MNRTDTKLYRQIGSRVRHVRLGKGMSQMRLAALARVHHNYVSRIELGKAEVSVAILLRIAKALDINTADLFADAAR